MSPAWPGNLLVMVSHRRGALMAQFQSASLTSPSGRCGGAGGCARRCTHRTLGRPARSWSNVPSGCEGWA